MSQKLKVKLSKIAAVNPAGQCLFLTALDGIANSNLVPAKTAYWAARIKSATAPDIEAYDLVRRQQVIKLGSQTPSGYVVQGDALTEFKKELDTLERDIELPISERLKLPWNEKLGVDLTPILDIIEEPS